jgi:hypothetical protein
MRVPIPPSVQKPAAAGTAVAAARVLLSQKAIASAAHLAALLVDVVKLFLYTSYV